MIKLEDLKIGDKIYGVTADGLGLYVTSTVERELLMLDIVPNTIEAVICKGGLEIVSRGYEKYLFRTEKEAEEEMNIIRLNRAKELLNSEDFIDKLFEYATSSKSLNKYTEYPIYKIAVDLYKKNGSDSSETTS